jgi:hypothetical protein
MVRQECLTYWEDTLSGRAALLKPLRRYGVLSGDKRSQLTQLALLWRASQVWRMWCAGDLDL